MKKEIHDPEISIVLPCRNEEKALPYCLKQIQEVISKNDLNAEIIVSDSSIDSSPDIARKFSVNLIKHDKEGYGNAYMEGIKIAKGKYIFMADCDGTYDFNEIPNFLKYLKEDYDLVIGNRFANKIEKGVMPGLHKHLGNPFLSGTLRLFFGTSVRDSYCGLRAIKKQSLDRLNLHMAGMEYALEMIVKSVKNKYKIKELPIKYHPRIGKSKLNTLSDGWRSLRYMLLYSPLFLFFIPGIILFLIGIETMLMLYFENPNILGVKFYFHPMFISSLLTIVGIQLIMFTIIAKTYGMIHLNEESYYFKKIYRFFTLEKLSSLGFLLTILGSIIFLYIFLKWAFSGFGSLNETKNAILALTLITVGIQTIFSSFIISILELKEK